MNITAEISLPYSIEMARLKFKLQARINITLHFTRRKKVTGIV